MKIKEFLSKFLIFVIVVAFCLPCFYSEVSAVETKGSITLHVADFINGQPIENMSFRLYFFATAHKKGDSMGYEYVVPYGDCNMDVNDHTDSYLPVHLANYAQTHSLSYTEKSTDSDGNAFFDGLVAGLYLAVPNGGSDSYFVPSPFVIYVPEFDKEDNNWDYDVVAKPKMLAYSLVDTSEETYISVKKEWETNLDTPGSITVSLLCDFQEVERVTLNEENNWSHRWDHLSKQHTWSVVESDVPEGYTVSYIVSENTVTVINTHDSYVPEKEEPETTSPVTDDTTKPQPTSPSEPTEHTTKPEELIDTGQLNWPVPVFSIAGLLLFSFGWAMLNLGKKDEETP